MKISCIIIDDEPLARQGLKEYIADTEFLQLDAEFDNALPAASVVDQQKRQLLFLDIQLPRITGLDFFKSLQHPPPVVFTTAYPEYALEGFEVNALDYLLKPISFDRFLKAALKAKEFYEVREKNAPAPAADHFFIKADGKLVRLLYDEILFAEALQNYVVIHTVHKKYMTYLTFKSVEEYLPADRFLKVHKSYIISMQQVSGIEINDIIIGKHQVPVSRNLKEEVMARLLGSSYLKRKS
jgi:DNA-binding LytR/AlgR family response regulator